MIAITTVLAALFAYPVMSSGELLRRQDLSGVPACGQTCLITAATNPALVGRCSLTDVSCLCKNDKFQSSVTTCALSACSAQDQAKMLTWATATCPATTSTTAEPAPSIPSADAAELAGLPPCGQSCLVDTASNSAIVGSCSPNDVACLCGNSKFMGTVTQCVASKCSLSEESTMLAWSTTTCSAGAEKSETSTTATGAATSTAAATAPSQTSVSVIPLDNSSSSSGMSNTTVSTSGNSTSVVTVTYTSANPSQATSVAKAENPVSTHNSTESSSAGTVLMGAGYWIMASVLVPSIFL